MKLTNYKYGNTEFAIDISRIHYIAKDGSKSIVIFLKREEHLITFESYREREKAYEDILKDIETINKPIVCTKPYTTYIKDRLRDSFMKNIETERDDKRYCSTCAHLGEPGWLCFEECSDKYHDAWIPKEV